MIDLDTLQRRLRPLIGTLLLGLATLALCVLLTLLLGILTMEIFGTVENWQRWREGSALGLLAWRLVLYILVAWLWLKLRALLPAPPNGPASAHLNRIQAMAIGLILFLEASKTLFY